MAGGQDLEVLGAGISCGGLVGERDAVVKMHYIAVAFPKGKVYGVARMQHCEGGCMVDCLHNVYSLWCIVYRGVPLIVSINDKRSPVNATKMDF